MSVAVIGIGQRMRGDDAAGLEGVRHWQLTHRDTAGRPDVKVMLVDGPGLDILELLEGVDAAVLVDAVRSAAGTGTLHRADPTAGRVVRDDRAAAHGWGVAEVLRLARSLSPKVAEMPMRLIGVEAARMELGEDLSEPVRGALDAFSDAIEDEVLSLLT